MGWAYATQGRFPQALQGNAYMYRKNNYGAQMNINANPDNHWDSKYNQWTTDAYYGLDLAPKRPHLDLKDPTKTMFKFRHGTDSVNLHKEKTGYRGF